MSQLKSKNLVPFSAQKLCYYFAAVSQNPKACCLSCKIPIFTGLHLGVVTPILGNPFCPRHINPSLKLFFLMSITRSGQIWLENFTFFNQILKYFSVTGGSWETLIPASALLFCKLLPYCILMGLCSWILLILLYSVLRKGIHPQFLLLRFSEWKVWKLFCLALFEDKFFP